MLNKRVTVCSLSQICAWECGRRSLAPFLRLSARSLSYQGELGTIRLAVLRITSRTVLAASARHGINIYGSGLRSEGGRRSEPPLGVPPAPGQQRRVPGSHSSRGGSKERLCLVECVEGGLGGGGGTHFSRRHSALCPPHPPLSCSSDAQGPPPFGARRTRFPLNNPSPVGNAEAVLPTF